MKNCDEMVSSLIERREHYMKEQRAKRKNLLSAAVCVCSLCFAMLVGFGIWQGKLIIEETFDKGQAIPQNKTEADVGSNMEPIASDYSNDVIGMVKVNGIKYVQCSTVTKVYTPDEYLGYARDYEGTYQKDSGAELYVTKEDSDVLLVKLESGDYLVLMKETD